MSSRVDSLAAGQMRCGRRLALAAGVSGLAMAALAAPALADTTVNGGSSQVSTSTAANGSPDNVVQTGTLTVTSGAAIKLDSNNTVTNSGTIQATDADNVTGVQGLGGHTGSITNSGTITFNESSASTTTDSAGDVIGPFSKGGSRYGIRLTGPGAFNGDILNSGAITITGADSAGISVETPQAGSITSSGAISMTGDGSAGLRTTAAVNGSISVSGSISVNGATSASGSVTHAISLGGDVGGGLAISSGVSATGYHSAVRPTTAAQLTDLQTNDAAQGGAAVQVMGSLGAGLLVAAPPAALSTTVTDVNGDGIADSAEGLGSVTSYGSAPAIVVGGVGRDVSLGLVGTGDSAYGVVIGGSVLGSGLRDGTSATAIQLGVAGGGAVNVATGIRVTGTVAAQAYSADATALHLLAGAAAPQLSVAGTINATLTGDTASSAQAVVVDAGAALPAIYNSGTIRASVDSSTASAYAIVDHAGSLTHLENTGTISAVTATSTAGVTPSGAAVAIDDSRNTTGLSLLSYQGAGLAAPAIIGAVKLGSGGDSLDIQAGVLTGDVSFGAGANSLTIAGGANVTGAITAQGGTLALSVGSGAVQFNNTGPIAVSSLSLASGSATIFTVDPAAGQATELDVAGPANLAAGAKVGVRMTSILNGQATYALIRASQLSAGALDESLLTTTPYIYDSHLAADASAGTLSVTLSRKTAAELALPASLTGGYEPVVAAAAKDQGLSTALLAQTTRGGFMSVYQQLLPEHSGGIFRMASEGVEAFGRPLDDRQGGGEGGAWAQEVDFVARQQNNGDIAGYNSWGAGLVGGYEMPETRVGIFGLDLGAMSGELRPDRSADATDAVANLIEVGGYWRKSVGAFSLNARLAGEYLMAKGHRAINFVPVESAESTAVASGHWNGWGVASRVRATYELHHGSFYLRPQVGLDFLQLSEGGYSEHGGGALDLTVASRKTTELSAFAGAAGGAAFGDDTAFWGPELLLGYRQTLAKNGGVTTANFDGSQPYTLGQDPLGDGGVVARLAVKSESGPAAFSLEVGGEHRTTFNAVDAKIAAHFSF